ncbi:redoxin domain-containing protein [Granulicella mallensis]|uniref:redoxin domain-containing protein n=1 Tax=Granulicella mallensis TaxID=940614 RepID=UPI00160E9E31|nr:redoxin domain-containing protein [Granulicella mallensis]
MEMFGSINWNRRRFLGNGALILGACQLGRVGCADAQSKGVSRLPIEGEMSSLAGAAVWINSTPLTPTSLRGKVVLVDFWTFSCINSIRTLPYLRAWSEKYKDKGLVIIGVQSPEFTFEKNLDNVRWAVQNMRLGYPIAVDNEHAIWDAFNNEYWPALYFVDARGRIRHHQFGEGAYEQSEAILQQLLVEAGARGFDKTPASIEPSSIERAAAWNSLKSPETYVGYRQAENFASSGGLHQDKERTYAFPSNLNLNRWALSGDWKVGKESAIADKAGTRIVYRFHARDLHLVMGPAVRGTTVRYRISVDGQAPHSTHGVDVDEQGNGTAIEPRLYQLIRQTEPIADHEFEIEFLDPDVEVFVFTFG